MHRYLCYYVTKQADPWFDTQWRRWKPDADNCDLVIVDLEMKRRYWNGSWDPCDTFTRNESP